MKFSLAFFLGVLATIISAFLVLIIINPETHSGCNKCIRATVDISSLNNAVSLYLIDNGKYPDADKGLEILINPNSG